MLSKCANPACTEIFRYLHQGKIFHLTPGPTVPRAVLLNPALDERFWLCELCSKEMTVVWNGTQAKVIRLPKKIEKLTTVAAVPASETPLGSAWARARRVLLAATFRHDR